MNNYRHVPIVVRIVGIDKGRLLLGTDLAALK
jgi:hypothetical protein